MVLEEYQTLDKQNNASLYKFFDQVEKQPACKWHFATKTTKQPTILF